MREDYTLLTPENVELRYEAAGLGSRMLAATIDYLILWFGFAVLAVGFSFAFERIAAWLRPADPRLAPFITYGGLALLMLLVFFGWWGYFLLFELLWNGQSPGKRLLRLRVVRAGGQPVDVMASLVRNVLRAIDVALLVGVLVMLLDRSTRRLGDFAAGTLVVREPRALGRSALSPVAMPEVSAAEVDALPNAGRLTMAHYTLLRDYFGRRAALPPGRADALAARLAADLARLLEVEPDGAADPIAFLAAAARAFESRHQYR